MFNNWNKIGGEILDTFQGGLDLLEKNSNKDSVSQSNAVHSKSKDIYFFCKEMKNFVLR